MKTLFKQTALAMALGFLAANAAQAFDMGNMMNPSKWMGGKKDNDNYDNRDQGYYGGPGAGYGAPPQGGYPPQGYGGAPGYGPAPQGYPPPQGYAPQQGYAPPQGYAPQQPPAPAMVPPPPPTSGDPTAEEIRQLKERIRRLEESTRR